MLNKQVHFMLDDVMIHESIHSNFTITIFFYLHYYAHVICFYGTMTILDDFCENIANQMIKYNDFNL